jgi:hypothetical protein
MTGGFVPARRPPPMGARSWVNTTNSMNGMYADGRTRPKVWMLRIEIWLTTMTI